MVVLGTMGKTEGKPVKNRLFWRYLAAETIPPKIRINFCGCRRTYGYFRRLVVSPENLSTFCSNDLAVETKLSLLVFHNRQNLHGR
jgi:hypothetical protein